MGGSGAGDGKHLVSCIVIHVDLIRLSSCKINPCDLRSYVPSGGKLHVYLAAMLMVCLDDRLLARYAAPTALACCRRRPCALASQGIRSLEVNQHDVCASFQQKTPTKTLTVSKEPHILLKNPPRRTIHAQQQHLYDQLPPHQPGPDHFRIRRERAASQLTNPLPILKQAKQRSMSVNAHRSCRPNQRQTTVRVSLSCPGVTMTRNNDLYGKARCTTGGSSDTKKTTNMNIIIIISSSSMFRDFSLAGRHCKGTTGSSVRPLTCAVI
jgi:hypothetical protein